VDLSGPLDLFGLAHLLRTAEAHRKSFALEVLHPMARGGLCMREGSIFWARVGQTTGKKAVRMMLSWRSARFWMYPLSGFVGSAQGFRVGNVIPDENRPLSQILEPITGHVGVLDVPDLMAIFGSNGRAARVRIVCGNQEGEISLDSGRIIQAAYVPLEGQEAVEAMMRLPAGEVEVRCGTADVPRPDPMPVRMFLIGRDPFPMCTSPEEMEKETRTLARMPLNMQMRLARDGNFRQRLSAACSKWNRVALAVVRGGEVGEDLLEAICSAPLANPEVLRVLADHRRCRSRYSCLRALALNLATPRDIATKLLDRLRDSDLRKVYQDRTKFPLRFRVKADKILRARRRSRAF
jgi:hypothetical protein